MDRRTVTAFLTGALLTAAGFLVLGGQGDAPEQDRGPADTGAAPSSASKPRVEAQPELEGSAPAPSVDLGATEEERAWLKEVLVKERERREAARIREGDTGVQILERVLDHGGDPSPLLASYEAFRAPIVESQESPLVLTEPRDGETVSFKQDGVDRVIIELGEGTHTLGKADQFWRPVHRTDTVLPHVVIRGAGIDKTTLVAGHQWALLLVAGRVDHLVIRDLTLDGGAAEGALLDIRGEAAVALENVRVKGWKRAGHAAAIGVSGRAYLGCKGCEFIGRGAQSGYGISLRGRSLVLCEDCLFSQIDDGALIASGPDTEGGTALFRNCTFETSRLSDRPFGASVHVLGGSVQYGEASQTEEARRKAWGAEHVTELEGTVFEDAAPVCRLRDLIEVLERVTAPEDELVVGIALGSVAEGRPESFRIYALPKGARRTKTYVVRVDDNWSVLTLLPRAGGIRMPPAEILARARPLAEVLREADIPHDMAQTSLSYSSRRTDADNGLTIVIGGRGQGGMWLLDAESAEVLYRPR